MAHNTDTLILPLSVVSNVDVMRLMREIEAIDEFLTQASIRTAGTKINLPKTSRLIDEIVEANKLNILIEADRKGLMDSIVVLQRKAPVIHISFSANPSPLFIQRLMTWLRAEIHSMVLLKIGLQPNMGAGCIVRTKNKYFDFSLRQNFRQQRQLLIRELQGGRSE